MSRLRRFRKRLQISYTPPLWIYLHYIETNLRQRGLGVEVDSVKGDLAETENPFSGDEASSKWEERQKSRVKSPQLMMRLKWPCDSTDGCSHRMGCGWLAKAQATARVDVPTAPRQYCVLFSLNSLMSSLPCAETQKYRRNASGVDHRDTGLFFQKNDVTVWDAGF